jgi:hypothetical protein
LIIKFHFFPILRVFFHWLYIFSSNKTIFRAIIVCTQYLFLCYRKLFMRKNI